MSVMSTVKLLTYSLIENAADYVICSGGQRPANSSTPSCVIAKNSTLMISAGTQYTGLHWVFTCGAYLQQLIL